MSMCQYGVWPNCCNACKFCLRKERIPISKEAMIQRIRNIRENLNVLDWKDKFKHGISLLGGELYYITDEDLQKEFLLLVDDIIEKVLKNGEFEKYRILVGTTRESLNEFIKLREIPV